MRRAPMCRYACRLRERELPQARLRLIGKPVRASAQEIAANPRARSATLRVAERSGV